MSVHAVGLVLERDRKLTIRVSDDELRILEEIAEAEGLTVSDWIRMHARRAHEERFGVRKRRAPKK